MPFLAARRGGRVNREVSAGVSRINAISVSTRRLPVVVMLRAPVAYVFRINAMSPPITAPIGYVNREVVPRVIRINAIIRVPPVSYPLL